MVTSNDKERDNYALLAVERANSNDMMNDSDSDNEESINNDNDGNRDVDIDDIMEDSVGVEDEMEQEDAADDDDYDDVESNNDDDNVSSSNNNNYNNSSSIMGSFNDDGCESTTSECENFLYTRGKKYQIPFKVARVTVDPSIKILESDFSGYKRLTTVVLPEGLERIGCWTFAECSLLKYINIPSSVKKIGDYAFWRCVNLEKVLLPDGLKKLGESAFHGCSSIQSIIIPPKIKAIIRGAFMCCDELRHVVLTEGLEYLCDEAFADCSSLRNIEIPSTVQVIGPYAFQGCWDLVSVHFCDKKIQKLVSRESFQDWWNNGVSEKSLMTHEFLNQENVIVRLEMLTVEKWQSKIYDMFTHIQSVEIEDLNEYFTSIDSKLTNYELAHNMTLLALAIWKSKILEQHGQKMDNLSDITKIHCRDICGACTIIPNVLTFLLKE